MLRLSGFELYSRWVPLPSMLDDSEGEMNGMYS